MSGQVLCGPTLAVVLAAACGCGADRVAQLPPDPDLARAIAAAGVGKPTDDVARAQKPAEGQPAPVPVIKPLDQPPDRPADVANAPRVATVIATVNGEAILAEEVRATVYTALMAVRQLPAAEQGPKTTEIINVALNQIVEREVVLQDLNARFSEKGPAGKQGVKILKKLKEAAEKEFDHQVLDAMRKSGQFKSQDDFTRYFREQGMSLEMVRRQWERSFTAMEYLRQRVYDSGARYSSHPYLEAYYNDHPEEFKVDDNVVWQDLFIDASKHPTREAARAHAEALAARIRKGEDFVALAKQYDNGDSSLRKNSEGIGRRFDEIRPPEAAPILFKLKDGEVGPLIEMPNGFHIVHVVHREVAGQLPFDAKVQKQIKEKIRNEIGQREMKRIVSELKRKSIIEYASGIQ